MVSWLRSVSFRARLSSLVAAAVGVTLAAAAIVSYFAVSHQLYGQVDSQLNRIAASSSRLSCVRGLGPAARANDVVVQVVAHGEPVCDIPPSASLPVTSAVASVSSGSPPVISSLKSGGSRYRVLTESGVALDGTPVAIQIAEPINGIVHSLAVLRLILWIVSLAGIGLAIGLGYLVARTAIRPVERLTQAAEHVAATQELGARIEEEGDDELTRLARAFNSMLAALSASRAQQAQLVSDAGHELRTPLTSLRTNIEVLMRVADLPREDREALLADVRAQLEELTTLVGDVVELARQDEQQPEPVEIRLDEVVRRAVDRARRRAPGLVFEVKATPGAVRAQPALLERAVLNVLDNAVKWSPSGGRIEVTLERGWRWSLEVRDQGPGIAPEDLPRVFDRFYRAKTARAMPGSGLGLAIVRQVVEAHGGTVGIYSPAGGGTLVRIELPTVQEEEPDLPPPLPVPAARPLS